MHLIILCAYAHKIMIKCAKKAPQKMAGLKNQNGCLFFCGEVTRFDAFLAEYAATLFRSLSQLLSHNSFPCVTV